MSENFMMKLFGFQRKERDKPKQETPTKQTFIQNDAEGAHTIDYTGAGFFTNISTLQVEDTLRKVSDQVKTYRGIAMHPEAASAIEDIINEAITSSKTEDLVTIDLENVEGISDKIKDRIREEFKNVLRILNYKKKAYDYFRDFYIDGRLYFHKIVDEKKPKDGVCEVRQIDSTAITKVSELERQIDPDTNAEVIIRQKDYFLYNRTYAQYGKKNTFTQSVAMSPDAVTFIHSGLYNVDHTMVIGHLHKVIKPLNQLRMVEDAAVIYRLTRAPERRIFYIDVGRLPRHKAEQHVKEVMLRHRNNLQYDPSTGEILDNKKHMHMLEDFFLPRFDGSRGTEIDQLQSGDNLAKMDDVEYFQSNLYKSLNIPRTRLDPDSGFALGRASEISRDEVNFTKFIDRILMRFSGIFDDILGENLVAKGVMRVDEWNAIKNDIFYDFLKDSFFQELKEMEVMRDRVALLTEMADFAHEAKYFSKEWMFKNVLRMEDDEIKEMEKQIEEDGKEAEEEGGDEFGGGFGAPQGDRAGRGNFTPVGGSAVDRAPPEEEPDTSVQVDKEEDNNE